MTKDEIINELVAYDDGGVLYPLYELCKAMDAWAKRQSVEFDKWKYENRWFHFDGQYWEYTFEQGTVIGEKTYNKHYRKTTEQLYELFTNQQK